MPQINEISWTSLSFYFLLLMVFNILNFSYSLSSFLKVNTSSSSVSDLFFFEMLSL